MSKLKSLSLFVGTGECNAHCSHCAGAPLRKYAPKEDGIIEEKRIYRTLKECYVQGARYLSISSTGEPTLSPIAVTKTLGLVYSVGKEGMRFSSISLYSNGIRIGSDKAFCDLYLPVWKDYGLTTVYVTVHDINERKNAAIFGVDYYPPLKDVLSQIHDADLTMRANMVLSKRNIYTSDKFISEAEGLLRLGVDRISAWPVRGLDDNLDLANSPLEEELDKIDRWIERNHFDEDGKVRLLREKSREAYLEGHKLTLFPDGRLSNSWCN